ncbi:NUDIX domain-containing protein [Streptacidiphilus rugosus]|uniref:NUDIX domain-containing protein n=1 Tax=Streptacidiphilus rugosus TaxID=405783 RepID=UPI00068C6B4F|nr:NUDIX hydrolase [Streptacidiphilus rugosus]
MQQHTPDEHAAFLAGLPRAFSAASALVTDTAGRVLLVRCHNRAHYGPPGGVVEADESPARAAERELQEEVGLVLPAGRLLVVSWITGDGTTPTQMPGSQLVFDMGTVPAGTGVTLQPEEVVEAVWAQPADLLPLMGPLRAERIRAALDARDGGEVRVVTSTRAELNADTERFAAGAASRGERAPAGPGTP